MSVTNQRLPCQALCVLLPVERLREEAVVTIRGLTMAASSVRWLKRLCLVVLICPLFVSAFLNLEELNEMKYGIQILSDPVILGQVSQGVSDTNGNM